MNDSPWFNVSIRFGNMHWQSLMTPFLLNNNTFQADFQTNTPNDIMLEYAE